MNVLKVNILGRSFSREVLFQVEYNTHQRNAVFLKDLKPFAISQFAWLVAVAQNSRVESKCLSMELGEQCVMTNGIYRTQTSSAVSLDMEKL